MKLDELSRFVANHSGVVTAAQLKEAGFGPGMIDYAFRRGTIDKLTRGVYCSTSVFGDEFAAVCARWKKCVLSHASALYLLGLSDRAPSVLDVTVPHGYNPNCLKREHPGIRIHHVANEVYEIGVTEVKTPMGNVVRSYGPERSVADLLRARHGEGVDAQLMRDAMRGYFKEDRRDLSLLVRTCESMGVSSELQIYLEVLA